MRILTVNDLLLPICIWTLNNAAALVQFRIYKCVRRWKCPTGTVKWSRIKGYFVLYYLDNVLYILVYMQCHCVTIYSSIQNVDCAVCKIFRKIEDEKNNPSGVIYIWNWRTVNNIRIYRAVNRIFLSTFCVL